MSRRKRPRRRALDALVDQVGPEDGTDPRYWQREIRGRSVRKEQQLCRQVQQALQLHMLEEVFASIQILKVVPAPNTGRLLVMLQAPDPQRRQTLLEALPAQHGRLRLAVARAIHRRRAPELVFEVCVGEGGDEA